MKLPTAKLDTGTSLAEFDVWITPSLGEIRDTERFREELTRVVSVFEAMCTATDNFADIEHCNPKRIADTFARLVHGMPDAGAEDLLQSLASVLFLVTGKSDNNVKCQLPLHLRDIAKWSTFPVVRTMTGKYGVELKPVPRILKSDRYMSTVVQLRDHSEYQERLLREFVAFVLSDERYASQMWSVGRSYAMLKAFGKHKDLLTPLVVFQVRGSVSASGGHGPEELLRDRLAEWGLVPGVDFNITDVVVADVSDGTRTKTRAYDFVLPFETPGWTRRLFIQCQFYAGDSGSVSHKNVDQTRTSRVSIKTLINDPVFVEYLDGAGYFSSLNGDLKNLIAMPDTASFFQIRTAVIRLRRELQQIGFLVPLDLEHAILRCDGRRHEVTRALEEEGYTEDEIERCITSCLERGHIAESNVGLLSVMPDPLCQHE